MTPVEATSTCGGSHADARAAASAIAFACAMPSAPVQALAQPLLTTIAAARPPEAASRSRDTRTGAACARLVVNTAAALAGASAASSARSRAPDALMPQATPAARKPRRRRDAALDAVDASVDALTPAPPRPARPPASPTCASWRRSTFGRRGAMLRLPWISAAGRSGRTLDARAQRQRHRVLAAVAEQRAAVQSCAIFSGTQTCGTIVKPRRTKCDGSCVNAHSVEKPRSRAGRRACVDQRDPMCWPRMRLVHDERAHLGDVGAERRELAAADDASARARRRRNAVACASTSSSVRGSRCPAARLAVMSA